MHIPDHMLNGTICPVTAGISAVGIAAAVLLARKSQQQPGAMKFASLSALVFAAQMLNFPIQHGTSGHLIGGVLLASLLGVPLGTLAMAMILTIQCLVFSDGGLSVLGANILNMAVIGAGLGGVMFLGLKKLFARKSGGEFIALSVAAWLSVMLAAFACALELVWSNQLDAKNIFTAMLSTHARIGVGEVMLTALLYSVLRPRLSASSKRTTFTAAIAALVAAVMLSPFASPLPDGLQWVADKFQFFHEQAPAFVSPLRGYSFDFIFNPAFSKSCAGLIGIIVTAAFGFLLMKLFTRRGLSQ